MQLSFNTTTHQVSHFNIFFAKFTLIYYEFSFRQIEYIFEQASSKAIALSKFRPLLVITILLIVQKITLTRHQLFFSLGPMV